jgi:cytoskeletal protein RodZ
VESLGEKLKTAREKKGYTFEQVMKDTNIAQRYLEALESENFSQFPGEPYLLGFLRNYSEYLGLDSQELIGLYKSLKIQEQPVPVEQLLSREPAVTKKWIVPAAVAGAAILIGAVVLLTQRPAASAESKVHRAVTYNLDKGTLNKRLYRGDAVVLSLGTTKYRLELKSLGESASLTTPTEDVNLSLGQEKLLDLNGDGKPDVKIFVADLLKNEPTKGAMLRFELQTDALASGSSSSDTSTAGSTIPSVSTAPAVGGVGNGGTDATATAAASPINPAPVILSSPNPYPFTLQASFKGYCMFRWESDRKNRDERYFRKSDVLTVQAQNGIRIWASNAGAVKFQVIGGGKTVDVEIGGPGEVVVTDLKWVKDDDGRFKLTTVRLD